MGVAGWLISLLVAFLFVAFKWAAFDTSTY